MKLIKSVSLFFTLVVSVSSLASCGLGTKYVSPDALGSSIDIVTMSAMDKPDISAIRRTFSFLACGDNIIYGGNTKDAKNRAIPGGREYNFKPFYKNVADYIAAADVSFINQETIMASNKPIAYYPCFNSPQDLGYDLEELGYDIVNIANNHMLDAGTDGLANAIDFWKQRDVLLLGAYENPTDYDNIRTFEENGITVAMLSYTYETNGLRKSTSSDIVIPYISDEDIIRQTALARDIADVVMVSIHWGIEGAFKPNAEQRRLAKLMADNGVDVIIGHHPHVIEPVEWIEADDGTKTLCVYSLGNFIGEQAYDYNTVGGIVSFDVTLFGSDVPQIENVLFRPTVCYYTFSTYENTLYFMEDFPASLCASHAVNTTYHHSYNYNTLLGYVTNTIDKSFLPEWFADK